MSAVVLILLAVTACAAGLSFFHVRNKRSAYLNNYIFHEAIHRKFREKRPELTSEQEELVFKALRQYFQVCSKAGRVMVAMPSQVADDAWHEFILFTRAYRNFCHKALGRFLHHTPAQAMKSPTLAQDGIKRAWRIACAQEGIDPKRPARLPLLFAIDDFLNIADGFHYSIDCRTHPDHRSDTVYYCGSDIGCTSGCAGDSGGDDGGADGSADGCSGGCGGGCGGD